MKKIGLIFCGELRTFDDEFVIKNWVRYIDTYNINFNDIYVTAWQNRGRSAYSIDYNLNDNIDPDEIIKNDYVKHIFKTSNVKLYNYDDWVSGIKNSDIYHFKNINNKQFNSTFGLSFLRYESIKMLLESKKDYDVIIITRPDGVFIDTPPDYFLDGSDKVWHQRYNFGDVIYSTFICSNKNNIIDICNWYGDKEFIKRTLSKINRFEHCHILYKICEELGIKDDTYRGSLFCEPYRYDGDHINIKKINKKFWVE